MGIDKGNTNEDVMAFDSIYGIQYPGISGQNGGGNQVHLLYNMQATPSIVVIQPNRYISVKQVWLPTFTNIVDSVTNAGGIAQACLTDIHVARQENILSIGPNPVKDYAHFYLNFDSDKEIEINVFDLTGRKVMGFEPVYYPAGIYFVKADFSGKQEGFYFVQILENKQIISTNKLIKVN
ncbi:MAG: T9SS type A sorting domain-containing protein [Bacteroidales bacterium]|nr:T9SS type A sorting domain-containing protein [Bacteroidales bacterium]